MDDSPIPRCNFKNIAIVICLILTAVIIMEINVSTYNAIDDTDCFSFTSVSECENIGMTAPIGMILLPNCSCAFFALRARRKKSETPPIAPIACRQYAKILNC